MIKIQALGPISVNLESSGFSHGNVVIRRYDKDELDKILLRDSEYWSPVRLSLSHNSGCWLKLDFDASADENSWEKAVKETGIVLEAFSLFKSTLSMIVIAGLRVKKIEKGLALGGYFGLENTIMGKRYFLSNAEYDSFNDLLTKYENFWHTNNVTPSSSEQLKRISLARRYFMKSFETINIVDRYIFLSIALEALYGEAEQELTYRYSNRAALLLGDSNQRRKTVYEDTKDAYKLRSSIMHGGTKWKIDGLKVWKFTEIIRETILRSISLFTKGYTNIGNTLDNCMHDPNEHAKLLEDAKTLFGRSSEYKELEDSF